jgi:hypothetical protein
MPITVRSMSLLVKGESNFYVTCMTVLPVTTHFMCVRRMIDDWQIAKDLEGIGRGLIEVLSRYIPAGNEKTMKNPSHDILCAHLDSNSSPPTYTSRGLPLR